MVADMAARSSAPQGYEPRSFPSFAVTVDVVVLTIRGGELHVLLVERRDDPFAGAWALPGGFVRPDETLGQAAARELEEETGVSAEDLPAGALAQLASYGDPDRDPRMRVVSVAYLAVVSDLGRPAPGGDAVKAEVMPVSSVLGRHRKHKLAFDHELILTEAVEQARQRLETTSIATAFVGPEFTLSELREVYEAAWGEQLDPGNFRRKVLSLAGLLSPTGRRRAPGPEGGKPAEVFRASPELQRLESPIRRTGLAGNNDARPVRGEAPAMHTPAPSHYPNVYGDDPWDNDTVHWLLDQPGVANEWTRVSLFEALRRQKRLVDTDHPDIRRAESLAQRYGVRQIDVPRGRGRITRLERTDAEAPPYPTDEAARRQAVRAQRPPEEGTR